ncbi:MAG TPA: hypothetical protein DIC56_22945 [Rhizobium sp.]|nr:hypothetical protein [Rhizobium sp.]
MTTSGTAAAAGKGPVLGLVLGTEGYGVRRSWLELFRGLQARDIPSAAVVLRRGEMGAALEAVGTSVAYIDVGATPPMAGGGIRKYRQLLSRGAVQLKVLRALRSEINLAGAGTLVLQSPLEVPLAGLAARLSGIRAYWMMPNAISSGYPFDLNRRVYRFAFRHLNVVPIANSLFTDTTIGRGDFERHICQLGIDPAEFDPAVPGGVRRADLGIPENAIVLGVFARMVAEKGQLRLAEALGDLGNEAACIHLLLCGGPLHSAYAAELKSFVQDHGLTGRVHFTGPISDVASYYKICDVVVNSRLDPEPFGLSVIEGMMLGKPVLAHKAGGPGETVIDGQTGWHIQGPDKAAFVAALRRVLAGLPRLAEIGQAARAHALANFTSDRTVGRIVDIITGGRKA